MSLQDRYFRLVEGELFDFEENKKRLQELKEDIAYESTAQSYDEQPRGSRSNTSTTERQGEKILTNKVACRLANTIEAIERAKEKRFDPEHLKLYNLRYRERKNWQVIIDKMSISKSAYYRKRKEVVRIVAEEMGLTS